MIKKINEYDALVGEVAWLSDYAVLKAMRGKCLGLVTQNRDINSTVRRYYAQSLCDVVPETAIGVIGKVDTLGEIRMYGTSHSMRSGWANPSAHNFFMHRKVLILGNMVAASPYFWGGENEVHWVFEPKGYFTGSCNLSYKSRDHCEEMSWVESEEAAAEQMAGFWETYKISNTVVVT